jgi:hypothetical protein
MQNCKGREMIIVVVMMLLSFSGKIIGSQEPQTRTLELFLDMAGRGALCYLSKDVVDACNDIGIESSYNMPFLRLKSSLGDYVSSSHIEDDLADYRGEALHRARKKIEESKALPEALKDLRALPLSLIQKRKEDGTLAIIKTKAELCYKLILTRVHLQQLTAEPYLLEQQIQYFRENPNWYPKDKLWLLSQHILEERDGEMEHGSEGYFKDEGEQEQQ